MLYRRRLVPDEKNNFVEDYKQVMTALDAVNNGEYHLNLTEVRDFSQVQIAGRGTVYGVLGSNVPSNSM